MDKKVKTQIQTELRTSKETKFQGPNQDNIKHLNIVEV